MARSHNLEEEWAVRNRSCAFSRFPAHSPVGKQYLLQGLYFITALTVILEIVVCIITIVVYLINKAVLNKIMFLTADGIQEGLGGKVNASKYQLSSRLSTTPSWMSSHAVDRYIGTSACWAQQ